MELRTPLIRSDSTWGLLEWVKKRMTGKQGKDEKMLVIVSDWLRSEVGCMPGTCDSEQQRCCNTLLTRETALLWYTNIAAARFLYVSPRSTGWSNICWCYFPKTRIKTWKEQLNPTPEKTADSHGHIWILKVIILNSMMGGKMTGGTVRRMICTKLKSQSRKKGGWQTVVET